MTWYLDQNLDEKVGQTSKNAQKQENARHVININSPQKVAFCVGKFFMSSFLVVWRLKPNLNLVDPQSHDREEEERN